MVLKLSDVAQSNPAREMIPDLFQTGLRFNKARVMSVSYTHLTLPTILLV